MKWWNGFLFELFEEKRRADILLLLKLKESKAKLIVLTDCYVPRRFELKNQIQVKARIYQLSKVTLNECLRDEN